MVKKSSTEKIKSLIFPLAFILIVILSVIYKFVFKGNGAFSIEAFKGTKTYQSEETEENETGVSSEDTSDPASGTDAPAVQTSFETKSLISVYICGEVNNPGIYEAPKGVLLNEIIEDAGGLTEAASVNNINFVYRIECNMSIYIPSADEIARGFTGNDIIRPDGVFVWGETKNGTEDPGENGNLMVNINTASEDELKTLPGIGDVTAKSIVDYRKSNPFKSIEDIKNVSGIGDSKFERIRDCICV